MRSFKAVYLVPLCLLAFFLIGYVVYPLGRAVAESFSVNGGVSLENYLQLISPSSKGNWEAVANSVLVSLLTVLFSCVVGLFFAFVFTQYDFPFKEFLSVCDFHAPQVYWIGSHNSGQQLADSVAELKAIKN